MKGRHQFRRRFSLQPSFLKEEPEEDNHHNHHSNRVLKTQHSEHGESPTSERTVSTPVDAVAPSTGTVRHKIVVMGAAKVGKSSIISQFLYGTFSSKYKRTVEEMHHGDFSVAGVRLTLDILDTSGAYEFPAMRALSIQSADAFVLVYDVTDASTFEEMRAIRDQIHETKGTANVPIVVVGNKADLSGDREWIGKTDSWKHLRRKISTSHKCSRNCWCKPRSNTTSVRHCVGGAGNRCLSLKQVIHRIILHQQP
ncbi:unnamed protein product [Acanthoscelides obtectus]|uniref:Uncharacterized protein n=1 Tax=Acanthoscelides obtectus TaxID=200917 RepID=A0A9P0M0Z1_ACAOB|nr:unnamed protein product [Acanthoscelides obtectus]CAK1645876.1 Ras-related protein Rap-1 [Acanthoscelides obtectus]